MQPALFVSHGAPTLSIEPSPARDFLAGLGDDLARRFGRPEAVIVVSAHWETEVPTIGFAAELETIHDFRGFPDELYRIRYPARGSAAVARKVAARLADAGLSTSTDPRRGLDHGAWVPLRLMYPSADVPVVPLSLQPHGGTRQAYRVGEALAPLRAEDVLILGSGSITHNLSELSAGQSSELAHVAEFVDWLADRAAQRDSESLLDYRARAPHAVRNHPTDEHLLPFFTVLGAAAGAPLQRVHTSRTFGSLRMDSFLAE
jgi:4,5-DOPA dioxygenase extradiol